MNIMRKFLVGGGAGSSQNQSQSEDSGEVNPNSVTPAPRPAEQELLGLAHLKKLFADYQSPTHPLTESEKEAKLYAMLPLFCKIFGSVGPNVITSKFENATGFTQTSSRLLVTEVRRRASNQSTETAAQAIALFMQYDEKTEEPGRNGWLLLSALNLLGAEGDSYAEVMTSSSVPSTLVKCLYLFFDLPPIEENVDESTNAESEFSQKERRILLQKMFIQLLIRLCAYVPAVEELARKDDLTLLFSAVTSPVPEHNMMWRKTAADILLVISRSSLSQPVVSYLHNKGCIALCVENMQRAPDLKPLEIVEMFVTVFCFLKDSSEQSQTLLEDFRTCQGYIFLSEFLLKLEQTSQSEWSEAARNLVLLMASLSFCGHTQLKPSSSTSPSTFLFQMENFQMPEPENNGSTVRNIHAFQALQTVFLKSRSSHLGGTILDAVSTIYSADDANYFLLESQNTLTQFCEKVALKPSEVQEKFFQLVEFLVHRLRFVPCKELIALSLILKGQQSVGCCSLASQSLASILKFDPIFKDVFREVGMLEAFVSCLKTYAQHLKSDQDDSSNIKDPEQQKFGELVLTVLTDLVSGNSQNAAVFRDSQGTTLVLALVRLDSSRKLALGLMQQLILAAGNDEDMTSLLELLVLRTSPSRDWIARTEILHSVIACLKESHRARTIFRKVAGFIYPVSVLGLIAMEGILRDETFVEEEILFQIFNLLRAIFSCLTVAMRYEPANARYFQVRISSGGNFFESIRALGCFSGDRILSQVAAVNAQLDDNTLANFRDIFEADAATLNDIVTASLKKLPKRLVAACVIVRMLYDMTIDLGHEQNKPQATPQQCTSAASVTSASVFLFSKGSIDEGKEDSKDDIKEKRSKVTTLNLTSSPPDPIIVHPSVLTAMLKLLPCIAGCEQDQTGSEPVKTGSLKQDEETERLTLALQFHLAESIKSLLRIEKNQQIMADVNFLSDIFSVCKVALEDESHLLHIPFQYLLERLAAQKLEPKDLRTFLRLGDPLACLNDQEMNQKCNQMSAITPGGFIPLTRVKTLVSMTTPRDLHVQNNTILPPFVELDMMQEGFGCLFLPSLAPSSPHAASVVGVSTLASQESSVIGGIGLGDRAFPSQPGLTFASWICINKFSDPRSDPHPVRLFTIARQVNNSGQEEHYVCLAVSLSARDKALMVSTQETPMSKSSDWHPDFTGDFGARVWFPDLIKEGEWHHIIIVLNRQVLKNSTFSLFVNGQHITTQRMHYISQSPGGGGPSNLNQATSVYAFIGTPPQWRRHSRLCWKQGPCLMTEDIASPQLASLLYKLGPHYLGSLQAPQISSSAEVLPSQISEEKIIFGLNAVAVSQMTLSKMKRIYSKVDIKSIARHLGMPSGENATPIRVVHNSAGHLFGPARSLGGVLIGYLGVRVFNPQPVSKVIETVGGCDVLLAIVAMSRDMEALYAGVKALVCVLKSNPFARYEMEADRGYQTLAMLLRKKLNLLNSHILHLCFTMAGTLEAGGSKEAESGQGGIPNIPAFRDVLCDLELWHEAPAELEKSLFEHFFELIADSGSQRGAVNVRLLREFCLVEKLLTILKKGDNSSNATTLTLLNVIHALLCANPRVTDVLCFALFTAATLNTSSQSERKVELKAGSDGTETTDENLENKQDEVNTEILKTVLLRNRCLKLFFSLLYSGKKIHVGYCEDVVQVVGFDWIQLFLQGHLHQTTVVWGLRILMTLLSQPNLLHKFRVGSCNGHWLVKSEIVLQNKMGQALGQVSSTGRVARRGLRSDIFNVPGFQLFNWLMPRHIDIPEVYFLLIAMVLGQPVKTLPTSAKLDLDSIWNYIFGTSAADTSQSDLAGKVTLSGDTMVTILCMVRSMLNCETKNPDKLPTWLKEYPVTLTQFLFYLYHNVMDFMPVFMTSDVLTALAGTLFPMITSASSTPSDSPFNSPLREQQLQQQLSETAADGSTATTSSPPPALIYTQEDTLTNHPAKRNVMNFMRVLIVDALSLPASQKTQPVIDLLIDAQPENTTHAQQCRFQTELLGIVMDHLLAADILIGDQAALPIVPGGSVNHIAPNVFYLASRLVDKLWQGVFKKEPEEIFTFVLKLISQAKRRGSASVSLDGIYRCLNRTILYMLARPHSKSDDVTSQVILLEVMHKLVDNRNMIFCAGNHEPEFFASLTFCLLQMSSGQKIQTEGEGKTQWHVKASGDFKDEEEVSKHQGHNLLVNASSRVWELMYVSKKPVLEEAFKTSFGQQNATPPLDSISQQIYEPALKIWLAYIDLEKRACYSRIPPWEFHTQLQSKIQRVTGGFAGGLKRLTSVGSSVGSGNGSKVKKEEVKVEYSNLPQQIVEQSTLNHVAIVRDVVESHYKNRALTDEHMLKYTEEEWLATETRLTQERGLWGPFNESSLTKWSLDMTEGPSRMRKRLIRNDLFYCFYPYREEDDCKDSDKPHKYKKPSSHDSRLWYERHRSLAMFERENRFVAMEYDDCDVTVTPGGETIDEHMRSIGFQGLKNVIGQATTIGRTGGAETGEDDADISTETTTSTNSTETSSTPTNSTGQETSLEPNATPPEVQSPVLGQTESGSQHQDDEENSSGYQTVMRLLENGEKISHMYRCARVQGLDTAEGLLLFGREHFYILDGFTLVNGRDVHDIDHIPSNYYDPIIPQVPGQVNRLVGKRVVSKFAYDGVKEVHKRRYLLQPIAVEVFCTDGQNQFLAFGKNVRPKVYQKFLSVSTGLSDSALQSIAGQKRSANVEQSTGLFSSLMGETSVTQRWVRGEISNFQYLMALNTLAGRSYNDLMQYPVFPWVLADYSSEELDLSNPKTFRDLTKPMGAQTESRLEQFQKRFGEWDDPSSETPPYHYGTHYSSAMIVSSYLVRLEPFTQHFLHLQGGHFDLADRMFHSIEEAWDSSSRNNMADVRELIPEFFYLPDFLENRNNFDIGTKQSGESLDDVLLPPWAKNSPAEFIRMHREALECDYVSQNLHAWIDLIFGYKQQGQSAMDSVNVYHHLFYEGNVDIFSIQDPLQRNATIGFINNFGQIPKQLFKKPHPAKKVTTTVTTEGGVIAGGGGVASSLPSTSTGIFFHNLTNLRPTMAPIKELKGPVGQIQHSDRMVYAVEQNKVLVPGNSNRYLAWGYADQSFRLGNYESDKAVFICEPNYLVGQVLTCVCPNARLVLTAGTSSVVAVYEYHKKVKQLLIKKMLHGHTDAVICLAASPGWSIAVSGSRDRTAIIWDLSRYVYIKHLAGHVGPVAAVAINELTGDIVTCAGAWLYLWDVNGRPVAKVNTAPYVSRPLRSGRSVPTSQILCVACSQHQEWDRENVILTGSSDGIVRMWSLDYEEVPIDQAKTSPSQDDKTSNDEIDSDDNSSTTELARRISCSITGEVKSLKEEDNGSSDTEGEDNLEEQQQQQQPEPEVNHQTTGNEDFVVVTQCDVDGSSRDAESDVIQSDVPQATTSRQAQNDGYTWTKKLVFRAKLTMHTAFERADNVDPAGVTALAISKDHKNVYVGDDKGRVFMWCVSSRPGKGMVDHWVKDEGVRGCVDCGVKFTIYERKHHCRNCGKVFCSSCSQYQAEIPRLKINYQVRVCKACHTELKNAES